MRKIIVTEFISLDGVVEAPGGDETTHPHGGWQANSRSAEGGKYKVEELASVDAFLLGRKTYDHFSAYWPTQSGNPFAEKLNTLPKHIVSSTLQTTDWHNCHILRDLGKDVAALKNTTGGDILVYGSATLVKGLVHHDLVDELHLMVYPLVLGGGLKIFDDNLELKKFALKQAKAIENGIVILEYSI